MGLFDDDSIIGFDYNNDGKVDRLDDVMYFDDMDYEERMRKEVEEAEEADYEEDELEAAGLDRDELEDMDEDERREALEDAGLDPDDYDF